MLDSFNLWPATLDLTSNIFQAEVGAAFDTMKLIKSALDPKNIVNPGKVLWNIYWIQINYLYIQSL